MYWPKIETPRVKCNDKLTGPTILISGFIVSLWAHCVFVVGVNQNGFNNNIVNYILAITLLTHGIISFFTTTAVITGFQQTNPDFLKPWMYLKAIEITGVTVGIMLLCFDYRRHYIGVVPVGIIVLLIASYLYLCIFTSWKKMKDNPQPPSSANTVDLDSVILEKPPSYDSFANQASVM